MEGGGGGGIICLRVVERRNDTRYRLLLVADMSACRTQSPVRLTRNCFCLKSYSPASGSAGDISRRFKVLLEGWRQPVDSFWRSADCLQYSQANQTHFFFF